MTRKELESLFDLLALYFPKRERPTGQNANAWMLVLEPYTPEEVKLAVTEHLRTSKFYPAPQEISILCNREKPEPNAILEAGQAMRGTAEINAIHKMQAWHEAYKKALHERGLPTAVEAKASGIPASEWMEMTKGVEVLML